MLCSRQERFSSLLVVFEGVESDGGVRHGGQHDLRRRRISSPGRLVPRGHRLTNVSLNGTSCPENHV